MKTKLLLVSAILVLLVLLWREHQRGDRLEEQAEHLVEKPVGKLDLPLGTYVTIEGHKFKPTKPPLMAPGNMLLVDTVQGKPVNPPIKLVLKKLNINSLPTETRCILSGYESGSWIGDPRGLPPHTPPSQCPFQFHTYFVVVSVVEPESLATK